MAEEDVELVAGGVAGPAAPTGGPTGAPVGKVRWAALAGLPRPFWVLFAGTIVNRLGQFVEPFLALYLVRGRDLSLTTAGAIITCFGAGSFVSQPLGGWLADRYGRRVTMVGGLLSTAASMGLLGVARPLWLIAGSALLVGVAVDVYRPASQAAVADIIDPVDRPRAFAIIYWAVNLGVSVSGVLGGLLAVRGWWILFVADAATSVAFALLVARGVPESRPERPASEPGGYGPVLRDRLAVALAAATLISGVVYLQAYVALPLAMTGDHLSPASYGVAYAVNPVTVLAIQPLTLRWLLRRPPARVYAASILVLGAGFGLTYFAHSTVAYGATVFVWTLGEIGFNALGPTIINTIAPDSMRGRYNGLIGLAFGGASMLAPLSGTWALEQGRSVVWASCFAVSAVVAVAMLGLGPALTRRMAAGTPSAAR
jgi:MFS family permease